MKHRQVEYICLCLRLTGRAYSARFHFLMAGDTVKVYADGACTMRVTWDRFAAALPRILEEANTRTLPGVTYASKRRSLPPMAGVKVAVRV